MQISTIKNPNFEKPFRNPSKRTQVNILKKKFFGYLSKKIWFRVCSVTAKMFELRNSGENRRKRSEFFFENLPREYKDLILVKKKFKIISCLCTFKVKFGISRCLYFVSLSDYNVCFGKIFRLARSNILCSTWRNL
jgi:hypothetical protein